MRIVLGIIIAALPSLSSLAADSLPPCARTGAKSVFFNGLPALKQSDMASCPAGSYDLVPGVTIEGEPMVTVNPGVANCFATASANIIVNGKGVNRAGDVACPPAP